MHLADQAASGGASDEFDDGVVALLQELSQFGDSGFMAAGIAGDAKQQLMLLRCDAATPSSLFAEAQESAQCVTKPSEMARGVPEKNLGLRNAYRRSAAFHERKLYRNTMTYPLPCSWRTFAAATFEYVLMGLGGSGALGNRLRIFGQARPANGGEPPATPHASGGNRVARRVGCG